MHQLRPEDIAAEVTLMTVSGMMLTEFRLQASPCSCLSCIARVQRRNQPRHLAPQLNQVATASMATCVSRVPSHPKKSTLSSISRKTAKACTGPYPKTIVLASGQSTYTRCLLTPAFLRPASARYNCGCRNPSILTTMTGIRCKSW